MLTISQTNIYVYVYSVRKLLVALLKQKSILTQLYLDKQVYSTPYHHVFSHELIYSSATVSLHPLFTIYVLENIYIYLCIHIYYW